MTWAFTHYHFINKRTVPGTPQRTSVTHISLHHPHPGQPPTTRFLFISSRIDLKELEREMALETIQKHQELEKTSRYPSIPKPTERKQGATNWKYEVTEFYLSHFFCSVDKSFPSPTTWVQVPELRAVIRTTQRAVTHSCSSNTHTHTHKINHTKEKR